MPTTEKAGLMRSVNDGIALFAADVPDAGSEVWTFVCECGAVDCVEWVELDLGEYVAVRADVDGHVLAGGHRASSPAQRARRDAADAREGARALRAQAKLQRQRARRLDTSSGGEDADREV